MTQLENWEMRPPDVVAEVFLYATADGGRTAPAIRGWSPPCMVSKMQPLVSYVARLQLGDQQFAPGERKRVGFVFLTDEYAETMRKAGKFYLWEGRFVGEAVVVG